MGYVRCIKNQGYEASLKIGKIYKAIPASNRETRDGLIRVIDNEGEDYLYDKDYFEPVDLSVIPEQKRSFDTLTIHLDPIIKGILSAEAIAAHKSIGALIREWIDERLDLPVN